jgi:transposase
VGYEKRQVVDIVVSRKVTEYRAEVVKNERGTEFVAKFPDGVTRPVQYGENFKAKAVYMSMAQLIPFERIEEYFRSQCSIDVSTGSLFNFNRQAFDGLEKFEKAARRHLTASELLHNDETGINVNGKLRWLHSASNEKWTLFYPHEKRGTDAMEAMGILPAFKGISVHDHWKPYLRFHCDHAFCNAHHLRELERAWEQDG